MNPYLTKDKVNGSIVSITNLVKTKVDPPSAADNDAKKDPNNKFLMIVLSLSIFIFLIYYKKI